MHNHFKAVYFQFVLYHKHGTSNILCIVMILSYADRKIWKKVEASCHFTSSIVLCFNSGLLILDFYVIACYLFILLLKNNAFSFT